MAMNAFNPHTVKSSQRGPPRVLSKESQALASLFVYLTMAFIITSVQKSSKSVMKVGRELYINVGPFPSPKNGIGIGSYIIF